MCNALCTLYLSRVDAGQRATDLIRAAAGYEDAYPVDASPFRVVASRLREGRPRCARTERDAVRDCRRGRSDASDAARWRSLSVAHGFRLVVAFRS